MIHFCPNCQTERPLRELICEGEIDGQPCNWSLADEPLHEEGWRPQPVITREEARGSSASSPEAASGKTATPATQFCENGHPLEEGALMCAECGAGPVRAAPADEDEPGSAPETVIDGWRLLNQISNTDGVRERYIAEEITSGRRAVLTLYHAGAEPDPAIYDVLRRLSREHVPEIIATGRWNERAYEVAEEMSGGTLADLGIVFGENDSATVRHIVYELGKALNAFNENGLRHRDLRPGVLLVRNREPLDLVISGFGSARLSEFDLDMVAPQETGRYMAPETIMGGVTAASDWWSLGMILLEQFTQGACFAGIHPQAFLIHIITSGIVLPDTLEPRLRLLLRGLLARDWHQRWQWKEVKDWLDGKDVEAPEAAGEETDDPEGAVIVLGRQRYRNPKLFALAAAQEDNWEEALKHLSHGELVTWAEQARLSPDTLASLRDVMQYDELEDDFRLMLALKLLNADMPLIHRGLIVTPGWLLEHPLEGYRLISGVAPDILVRGQNEGWLARLKARARNVRQRAEHLDIELAEEQLRVYLLSTARPKLFAQWQERLRLLPESEHSGILTLIDRGHLPEEDLIILLSANLGLFRSVDAVLEEATLAAASIPVEKFSREAAAKLLQAGRQSLFAKVDERISGFARCGIEEVDAWAEQFRLHRRLPLGTALVMLAVPAEDWQVPHKQQYLTQLIDFFEKKISISITRGVLARMSIGKTSARIDLTEISGERRPASDLLEHLLQRRTHSLMLDVGASPDSLLHARLRKLHSDNLRYRRDTGIDGLYLGFPFLLSQDPRGKALPRVIPLLLWPARLEIKIGDLRQQQVGLAFDDRREEIRSNPALGKLLGAAEGKRWQEAANLLLGRPTPRAREVLEGFAALAPARTLELAALPANARPTNARGELLCAAVLFHVTFSGQTIREDLLSLCRENIDALRTTGLEAMLRLREEGEGESEDRDVPPAVPETERFFTLASDPSQEDAVFRARRPPGLLVEGPPGTGKSQTIVNMVTDAIGRNKSVLVICQKLAALEVVSKRLRAEGLDERMVMINEINDRAQVIRRVRAVLERLFASFQIDNGMTALKRQRASLAERIQILEGELDRLHEALYRTDEASGLSYRQLTGELVRLDAEMSLPDFFALRQKFATLDATALTRHEHRCASLVRLWLPSHFEDSPLAALRSFSVDTATLRAFTQGFIRFLHAEAERRQASAEHPASFELEDAASCRAWMRTHASRLLELPDAVRQHLARWLPQFRNGEGQRLLAGMSDLARELRACNVELWSYRLSPALKLLGDARLTRLSGYAQKELRVDSFCARLNPARLPRLFALRAFFAAQGVTGKASSKHLLAELLAAARLEAQWRPLRQRFSHLRRPLGLPEIASGSGLELNQQAEDDVRLLRHIEQLVHALASAPRSDVAEAAVLTARKQSLVEFFSQLNAAALRQEARQQSLAALDALRDWMEEKALMAWRQCIGENRDNTRFLQDMQAALPHLSAYQTFRSRVNHLIANKQLDEEDLELFAVLRPQEAEFAQIPESGLESFIRRLFRREACLGWKARLEEEHPELLFSAAEIQEKTAALAQADKEIRRLNRELLTGNIDRQALGNRREWEGITRLTGPNALRLREFIDRGAKIGLMRLVPVWLMNPDVASRVLPLVPGMFDTVIYDEASQMPVEYALPTLYRGKTVIVSGDEKQMPPTSFFSSRVENDEGELFDGIMPDEEAGEAGQELFADTWNRREIKDCPDLLQLARSVLPHTTLQIHYRSAYRELIAFSNAAFYMNRLSVPARHTEANIRTFRPLEVIRVDGLYQNQSNEDEAERLVGWLAEFWKRPGPRPSVGVVTFNIRQATLIEERLEFRAADDADFRAVYTEERERKDEGEDMSIFVKNVENVQGDERDVIVFSTTFGRNAQGTFRRNFGVLGQTGGERRLNVAISRARQKVVLMTSMPIADISDMLTTHHAPTGPRDYLQSYLEYARLLSDGEFSHAARLLARLDSGRQRGSAVYGDTDAMKEMKDGFLAAVADYIRALGWTPRVRGDGDVFGLDFAIEHPQTGLYAIGIECDTPLHALLTHARAREIWRPSVLRRSVPYLYRVSSRGWHQDGDRERARLAEAIDKALQNADTTGEQE
ncbi:MAG: protein kinase [Candidatus Accumulibacter sp.]|nr:protein kinase [Accumulibacter sp.]